MTISVPLSSWGSRVRAQVVAWSKRWPTFSWGTYPGHEPTEALATDGMVPDWQNATGRARGRAVAQAIWDERKQNGVWYVIHWGEIISITRPEKGWLPYFARNSADPSKSHHNHVHNSWHKDGDAPAVAPDVKPYTDGWVPALPWVFYLDKQQVGVKQSDSVWLLQKALGLKPYDGTYTDAVRIAVSKKQRSWGDDPVNCDGILGPMQAAKLFGEHVRIEATS